MPLATAPPPKSASGLRILDDALAAAFARRPFDAPWTAGALLALLGYVWVFEITTDMRIGRSVTTAIVNVATAWALGFVAHAMLRRWIIGRRPIRQLVGNAALAIAFTLSWYVSTISGLAWRDGTLTGGAAVFPFIGVAFVWQIFQGFAIYGAAAALAYLAAVPRAKAVAIPAAAPVPPIARPERLLLRDGDEIRLIDFADIVLILAADDYAEVVTATSRHLARRSLGEFEAELPPQFVRIHRSTIVNLARLVRAEPAGAGRMTLHLDNGDTAVASRTGARLVRERSA